MIIVFDLEATCWQEKPHDPTMEIIEIGAVKLDLSKGRIVDEFSMLVRPKINPILSEFCTSLTGITQDDLRGQHQFPSIYPQFVQFCGNRKNNTLAAWGDYDRKQMMLDCGLHELEYLLPESYLNVSRLYRELKGGKKRGLGTAVEECGLTFEGPAHRALNDAKMTARVLLNMFGKELQT